MYTEKNYNEKLSQVFFPEDDLLKFVEKIYSKAPTIEGIPNLKKLYVDAVSCQNVDTLKDLARSLQAGLDYDRKYQGCREDTQDYEQEKGYSWKELNSVYKQLQNWIEQNEK